jgi:hypothetical protein
VGERVKKDNNKYHGEGRINQKNDCSVIALSYSFNLDYLHAYTICQRAGRTHNKGFHLNRIFKLILNEQSNLFTFKANDTRKVTFHSCPKMSISRFRHSHAKGIYIIEVRGHVFTMKDGIVFNNMNTNMRIKDYFEVSNTER